MVEIGYDAGDRGEPEYPEQEPRMKLSERMRTACKKSSPWTLTHGLVLNLAKEVAQLEAELDAEQGLRYKTQNETSKRIFELEAENEALKLRTGICEWEYDEHHDVWETSCSNAWQFMNDGPKENECQYCMYCGGVIDALLTGGDDET